MRPLRVPPFLEVGSTISVVAPASAADPARVAHGIEHLCAAGYHVESYRKATDSATYLAGSDGERLAEFDAALRDPTSQMVLATRGGYGVARLLDQIDYDQLARQPKLVCGYSELTALHAAIQQRSGLVAIHGPNLIDGLGDSGEATRVERDALWQLVAGQRTDLLAGAPTERLATWRGGATAGRLVGGNLAVLCGLLGTPYAPDFQEAILIVEEVGEAPYRIDRMLTQLRLAGALDSLRGVLVGHFTGCDATEGPSVLEPLLRDSFLRLDVPVLAGLPVGHEHPNLPMPLGAEVQLDAGAQTLRLVGFGR